MHRYSNLMRFMGEKMDRSAESGMKIRVFTYNKEEYEEKELDDVKTLEEYRDSKGVVWIDVQGGYSDTDIEKIGNIFGLHPSAVRNSLLVGQRPSYEELDDHLFLIVSQVYVKTAKIEREQIGIFLKRGLLITIQQRPGDVFEPLRKKIRENTGKIRAKGGDFLLFSILREILDHYFRVLENLGIRIDSIEDKVLKSPGPEIMKSLHELRREILFLKHMVWPMREVIEGLYRDETGIISMDTKKYLRGARDIALQMIEIAETYRDMVSSMTDIYLSSLSYRTNEIMKILTIIATIFIPLTFVTGLYGMNFRNMPELYWYWGYPAALLGMLIIALLMLFYFRRKGWM